MDSIAPDTVLTIARDRWRGLVMPSGTRLRFRTVAIMKDTVGVVDPTGTREWYRAQMRTAFWYDGLDTAGTPWREPTWRDTVLAWHIKPINEGSVIEIGWAVDSTVLHVEALSVATSSWKARINIRRDPAHWTGPRFRTFTQ